MENKKLSFMKNTWTIVGVVFGVIVILLVFNSVNGNNSNDDCTGDLCEVETGGLSETDAFASCLTEYGAKMYGTSWCGYCKKQKALFEDSFKNVDYTDCDEDSAACSAAGVTGYPTWVIDGQKYPGVQQFERLSQLTGCEI